MIRDDFFDRIEAATNFKFSAEQMKYLVPEFNSISDYSAKKIISVVESCANIPRGVYGYTMGTIREFKEQERKQQLSRESWQVKSEDCAEAEEFKLAMKCIRLISSFENSNKLLVEFSKYMKTAIESNQLLDRMKKAIDFYSSKNFQGINVKRDLSEIF